MFSENNENINEEKNDEVMVPSLPRNTARSRFRY